MTSQVVYICPMQDYVRYRFMYGGYLPDPEGVLDGTGKGMLHVKVREPRGGVRPGAERADRGRLEGWRGEAEEVGRSKGYLEGIGTYAYPLLLE